MAPKPEDYTDYDPNLLTEDRQVPVVNHLPEGLRTPEDLEAGGAPINYALLIGIVLLVLILAVVAYFLMNKKKDVPSKEEEPFVEQQQQQEEQQQDDKPAEENPQQEAK